MKIIDAHAHICEVIAGYCRRGELRALGGGRAMWANGEVMHLIPEGYGDTNYTAEAAIRMMDENGVEAAVILQGSMYGFQNRYIQTVLEKYPSRFRGACTVDPFAKNAQESLEKMLDWTGIVKFEVSSGGGLMGVHDDFALDGSRMMPIYEMVNARSGVVTIDFGDWTMPSYQPLAVRRIAQQFPGLRIVMCHLLAPLPGHLEETRIGLTALKLPNVWFDIAALPKIASPEAYPYPSCARALSLAKEIVGAERLMFGTDMPFALTHASYRDLVRYIEEAGVFTNSELAKVFYETAKQVYF
ncbi:MAG: amidohydrolase [Spirochaetales bacterium]|jgi:predicted TIM-barrel fold metal-dependent hydrolase|nr:amidohydrolase [Spirochaetales bacterium]